MTATNSTVVDYRLHDRVALGIGWHCHWCGAPLDVAGPGQSQANHCGRLHARKQSNWRAQAASGPIRRCPRPEKVAYGSRGTALRFALAYRQHPYLCVCGTFHLTRRTNKPFAAALAYLALVVEGTGPVWRTPGS